MSAEQLVVWRLLDVVSRGSKTHSYKFAVLMAVIDLVMEGVDPKGQPPKSIDGDQVLGRVVESYWRQVRPIDDAGHARQGSQAGSLVDKIAERQAVLLDRGWRPPPFTQLDETSRAQLLKAAERPILGYALPLLQEVSGAAPGPFLFEVWTEQRTRFLDGRGRTLRLMPGAGDALLRFGPLLRDVIKVEWLSFVRARNDHRVPPDVLAKALFGSSRGPLARQAEALKALDGDTCFYCGSRPKDVDHFLPWSRTFEDGLSNLVLACGSCNRSKSDRLVGIEPLTRWHARNAGQALTEAATAAGLPSGSQRCPGLARALYLPAAQAAVPFWLPNAEEVVGPFEVLQLLA